jgi:hypothetical protein
MDLLDLGNLILILIMIFLIFKEEPLIEKLLENDKIQFALSWIKKLTMPVADPSRDYLYLGDNYTFRVDKLWIDDKFLIQDNGSGALSITNSPVTYTPYTN